MAPTPRVIDFHTHAFPDALAETTVPRLCARAGITPALDGKVASLLDSMDRLGIEAAVVLSVATKPEQFEPILRFCQQTASGRLHPFASVHPDDQEAVARIDRIVEAGLKGVKLHPYYQDFDLDAVLEQFRRKSHRRHTLIQMFVEIQLQAAFADGELERSEEVVLLHICRRLGVPEFVFRRLAQRIRAERQFGGAEGGAAAARGTLADAYAVLGVSERDDPETIKKAYRRLMSQHHPDKLVSKGLPEEMMRLAAQKTREIRQAYEQVRQARGF